MPECKFKVGDIVYVDPLVKPGILIKNGIVTGIKPVTTGSGWLIKVDFMRKYKDSNLFIKSEQEQMF